MATPFPAFGPLLVVLPLVLAIRGALGQPTPTLKFVPPSDFWGGGGGFPEVWRSNNNNELRLDIYGFRPYHGNFQDDFQRTLLRAGIEPGSQEARLLAAPTFLTATVPGAQAAILGEFRDYYNGSPREHLRLAILAGGAVALIDMSADSPQAFQRSLPGLRTMLSSLSVLAATSPEVVPDVTPEITPATTPTPRRMSGGGITGLYSGQTTRFQVNIMGSPGSGTFYLAMRYYLFSGDGRVHTGYDLPTSPGGDIRRFDYEAAERNDPGNAGWYAVQGSRITIRLGAGPAPRSIVAEITPEGHLKIDGATLKKVAMRQ